MPTLLVIGLIITAVVVTAAVTMLIERRRQRLHDAPALPCAHAVLRQFATLSSDNLVGFEEYNRLILRKLKVKQVNEVIKLAESGKPIQEQVNRFEAAFDKLILTLYPDFVSRVNALLKPDRQLVPVAEGRLNTELRLLAFMKLGFHDGARIARLLGLTLNTIYTYRNKAKSRALNRETFEDDLTTLN